MFRYVFGIVSLVVVFGINCSSPNKPEEASKYPVGYPQSAVEVAHLFASLPITLHVATGGYTEVGYEGMVAISMSSQDSTTSKTIVFSACTAAVKAHCSELKTLYAETTSVIFGVDARYSDYHYDNAWGSIVLIHGKYDGIGVAQEKRLYIGSDLVAGVSPDEIKVSLVGPKHYLILESYAPYSPVNNGNNASSYHVYDLDTRSIIDYGQY
jgi:hypothetical protein